MRPGGRLGAVTACMLALALAALPAAVDAADADGAPRAAATGASAAHRRGVPAANFFVEWRIRPAPAAGGRGEEVVVTSGSATTGGTGFGPGAVVVGTAHPGAAQGAGDGVAQGVRVANGRQATLRFDQPESTMVWDESWAARARVRSDASGVPGSPGRASGARFDARSSEAGVSGHEAIVHHVQGVRVTPWWTRGDTLQLELEVTHAGDSSDPGDLDLHSTVQAGIDEWLTVARLGPGDRELQVRVRWQ